MGTISLFEQISSYNDLLSAWTKVRANQGCAGEDGQSLASFERHLERNLKYLSNSLQKSAYRPGRSAAMAANGVSSLYQQGYHWVVDGDIDDYFDNIPHSKLINIIQACG